MHGVPFFTNDVVCITENYIPEPSPTKEKFNNIVEMEVLTSLWLLVLRARDANIDY